MAASMMAVRAAITLWDAVAVSKASMLVSAIDAAAAIKRVQLPKKSDILEAALVRPLLFGEFGRRDETMPSLRSGASRHRNRNAVGAIENDEALLRARNTRFGLRLGRNRRVTHSNSLQMEGGVGC